MNRFQKIKKLVFFSFGGLLVLFLAGIITTYIFEDDIKKFALEKIGENVTTEIKVHEVNFSLFKKFPQASLEFTDVFIKETFEEKDTLLFAKNVYLEFNVWDILSKKYEVNTVSIDDGIAKLKWKKDKQDNFHFWKTTDSHSSAFSFSIEKIILNNSKVEIDYLPANFNLTTQVENVQAKGKFDEKNTHITSKVDLVINQLIKGDVNYSDHYRLDGVIETGISNEGTVTVNNTSIDIDDIPFEIAGIIKNKANTHLDLTISTDELDINKVLLHLPQSMQDNIADYNTSGQGSLTCIIQGESTAESNPDLLINYSIVNGLFEHIATGTELDNIQAIGKFTILDGQPEKLSVSKLHASFEGNDFKLNGWLENFASPKFNISTKGHLSLEDIKNFADLKKLEEFTGILDINTRFEGELTSFSQLSIEDLKRVKIKGAANIHETTVVVAGSPRSFENIEARLIFDNKRTNIDFINGTVEDSDFHLAGNLNNMLPYLFFENERLQITADFSSTNLNFNRLITENENSSGDDEYHFIIPDDIDFDIKTSIEKFTFRKFEAKNLQGTAHLKNKNFRIDPISFTSSQGTCQGLLIASSDHNNNIDVQCNVTIDDIDINQLFYEFEDFGQELIAQNNIKGRASADIQFYSVLSSKLIFNNNKTKSTIDITINDGQLIELSAMGEISKYISSNRMLSKLVDEEKLDNKLRHINFSKLNNTLIVADNQIRIPSMDIYSSAMDITVAGTHSFDNQLDYSLGFKIRDILATKSRSEFGEVEDDGLSNSFYLSLKGTPETLSFGYDNIPHREKRQEDLKKEKETFKKLIKDEVQKNNSTPKETEKSTTIITVNEKDLPIKKKKKWFENKKSEDKTDNPPSDNSNDDSFEDDDDDF